MPKSYTSEDDYDLEPGEIQHRLQKPKRISNSEGLRESMNDCFSSMRREPWRHRRHGFGQVANDGQPNRFELFIMGDGEEKVTAVDETMVQNCVTFTFIKEDHTLGNLLRAQLLKDPKVIFAGYKVPHPLFPNFELRVQTTSETTPRAAVTKACQELIKDLTIFRNNFTREWELRRMVEPQ